jgi:hypothetical protein
VKTLKADTVRPSGSPGSLPAALLLFASAVVAQGCQASCQKACEKLLSCDELSNARVDEDECESACETQQAQYDKWEDYQKQDAFDQERNCIVDSTCAQVADGACYDDELFAF